MRRPTVLIATTDPVMAHALKARLGPGCRKHGLRLDVCPGGERHNDKDELAPAYASAADLFDELERRSTEDALGLADTLVVFDVGARLEEAFACKASANEEGWHASDHRAGVAVELLLRFPQVFPVFLSPAVPLVKACAGNIAPSFETSADGWQGFRQMKESLLTKNKPSDEKVSVDFVLSLNSPMNFVSPLDQGECLVEVTERFANGMRCWFDPTGLRTVVKNRFLGTLFGNDSNWGNTSEKGENNKRRQALLNRLDHVAVAVDEEREFALLNAYTAWKYGRRAWLVTTYAEFVVYPLWDANQEKAKDVVILRDIDLRFPDIIAGNNNVRQNLMDIASSEWKKRIKTEWQVRAISGERDIVPIGDRRQEEFSSEANNNELRLGQRGPIEKREYLGFQKPISTLYELQAVLGENAGDAKQTIAARLGVANDLGSDDTKDDSQKSEEKGSGHGAPYLNLAMAESLLRQARRCTDGAEASIIGALLASEAYELLLGMSKTTALEALQEMHRAEVRAEVSFPGVGHNLNICERKNDIEASLVSLYENSNVNNKNQVKRIFLSQFWADLRAIYRSGERFAAAEAANQETLLYLPWYPAWMGCLWERSRLKKACDKFSLVYGPKWLLIRVATTFTGWLSAAGIMVFLFSVIYGLLDGYTRFALSKNGTGIFFGDIVGSVLMTSITLEPQGIVAQMLPTEESSAAVLSGWMRLIPVAHVSCAYILFGLFISMFYRKIVRG